MNSSQHQISLWEEKAIIHETLKTTRLSSFVALGEGRKTVPMPWAGLVRKSFLAVKGEFSYNFRDE